MPRAKRICSVPGCPATTTGSRCLPHQRQADKQRGTKTERGYGKAFQAQRKRLKPLVDAGKATCWRCGKPISPNEPWHLGHDDNDRTITRGPEHALCNLRAAGLAAHRTVDN